MQTFEIKRGHGKTLEDGGLKNMMEEEFGSVKNDDESTFNASSFFIIVSIITIEFTSISLSINLSPINLQFSLCKLMFLFFL